DIVILPPPEIVDYVIALSKMLQHYSAKFVLGKRQYIPHISLYHIPVSSEKFADFSTALGSIAAVHSGGALTLRNLEMPVIQTDKPEWLRKLHQNVVKATVPYFDWDYGADDTWSTDYLPVHLRKPARSNLKRYGSPLTGVVFRPHITLTSFADKG